jgi:hypothetical protein
VHHLAVLVPARLRFQRGRQEILPSASAGWRVVTYKTILMFLPCGRKRSCTNIRKIIRLNRTNARAASIVLLAAIGEPTVPERMGKVDG